MARLVLHGETDGTHAIGYVSFTSDMFYSPVRVFKIPVGCVVKILGVNSYGADTEWHVRFCSDYRNIVTCRDVFVTGTDEGNLSLKEPIVLRSISGNEGVAVYWVQRTAGNAYIDLIVDVGWEEDA